MNKIFYALIGISFMLTACGKDTSKKTEQTKEATTFFPFDLPEEKPNMPLSAAMNRNYDAYMGVRPETNELFTQFKYTKLKGFDYNNGDGTISRRDPSKVIFENGKYYIWYTHRETPTAPVGIPRVEESNDTIPSADWDLSDIFYATSKDGFTWEEQGVAVPRPAKPNIGHRSVTTTDILKFKGKYYLYYQAFSEAPGKSGGDNCPVAVSSSDSPNGPWTPHHKDVIPNGPAGAWDQFSIHDPYPIVHNGKIYLYYKSDFGKNKKEGKGNVRMHGLAIAENPLGPFKKHELNPIMNSGHETTLFPFKEGVAAFAIRDGNESNTIQYAKDWVNFEVAASVNLMPDAGGPFVKDAFTDTKYGQGITWGISHFARPHGDWKRNHVVLVRFDCDLSLEVNDPAMKKHHNTPKFEYLLSHGLNGKQRERISAETKSLK
ncbi:family 43 glycosylhydrolase [Polaribacter sp. Z014]|uniref:glycoside hydrolase family 117 protein n=1 Tax=Polaribacter sp. Z014 TaxID=2927126 RepID=UPI002020DEE0|nr:family 43 glycosylhydrolase [Polaribacter sp. Z014]MCL7764006.1 family 43 glycosylhydrolase [Polaribacter sp. Z014]